MSLEEPSYAMNTEGITRIFLRTAGGILAITGLAKLWSATGMAKALAVADPLLSLPFNRLLLLVGLAELIVAACSFLLKNKRASLLLVAWLSGSFLFYRFGLWTIGWHKPCSCMGSLTEALHLSPGAADNMMKVVLAYLLVASYGLLIWHWWLNRAGAALGPAAANNG